VRPYPSSSAEEKDYRGKEPQNDEPDGERSEIIRQHLSGSGLDVAQIETHATAFVSEPAAAVSGGVACSWGRGFSLEVRVTAGAARPTAQATMKAHPTIHKIGPIISAYNVSKSARSDMDSIAPTAKHPIPARAVAFAIRIGVLLAVAYARVEKYVHAGVQSRSVLFIELEAHGTPHVVSRCGCGTLGKQILPEFPKFLKNYSPMILLAR
jgi:hypothetical protein